MSFSCVPEQGRVWEQCQVEGGVECQSCDPQIVYFQSVYVAITQPVREMRLYVIVVLVIALAIKGLTLPYFEHPVLPLDNSSYISIDHISDERNALKCVTDNVDCCNDASVGNWRDVRGSPVQEGRDGTSCLYVTRGDGEISLNRKSVCFDHTSGLWRCDIPDSSGDMQSLYLHWQQHII